MNMIFAIANNAKNYIIECIKNCFKQANHPTAFESEAKAALFLENQMTNKYNMVTLDFLTKKSQEHQAQYANISKTE